MSDRLEVPVEGFIGGEITPPASKSYSHRALNLAWLSGQPTVVRHLLEAEDLELFRTALGAAGWRVEALDERAGDWQLTPPSGASADEVEVYCGNAGTMFRFLAATLAVVPGRFRLDGSPRLRERPIAPLVDAVRQLGAQVEYLERDGYAPLRLHGGSLVGGSCRLDAGSSSQYLSALLMACSFAARESTIEVTALTSQPYVEVTLDAMARVGLTTAEPRRGGWRVRPVDDAWRLREQRVEADDSAVAYPVAAAMISGRAAVLKGLRRESIQGDRRFLEVLERMGAQLSWRRGDLVCAGSVLRPVEVDLSQMPDQVPTLAAVAAFAPGVTRITNVPHLRIKESDRLAVMAQELTRVGVQVEELDDGLVITGDAARLDAWDGAAEPVVIDPHDDHRIAMSLALVALRRPHVSIDNPTTVGKSYPRFWRDLFAIEDR